MEEFLNIIRNELIGTGLVLLVLVIIRYLLSKTIRKVGRVSDLNEARTRLIIKYISFGLLSVAMIILILIWGVNVRELGLILSSVFAVIGVALFAQWSILSNITAGIILFFSFPYKIGDKIRIMDKETEYRGEYLIEDIKAYHLHLRNDLGELVTYPNNLMLQKAIIISDNSQSDSGDSDIL